MRAPANPRAANSSVAASRIFCLVRAASRARPTVACGLFTRPILPSKNLGRVDGIEVLPCAADLAVSDVEGDDNIIVVRDAVGRLTSYVRLDERVRLALG